MSKVKTQPSEAKVPTLVVPNDIFAIVREGRSDNVLTWKVFTERPEKLVLSEPGGNTKLHVEVKHMDTVFGNYRPNGYPEKLKAYGKMTRFIVRVKEVVK